MSKERYKRKRMNKIRRERLLYDESLSSNLEIVLNVLEFYTLFDLECFSEEENDEIPGIAGK